MIYETVWAIQKENFTYIYPISLPPEFKGGILMVCTACAINFIYTAYPFLTWLHVETHIAVYDFVQVARTQKYFFKFQVHFILSRVEYATKNNVKKFGINKLLDTGIYKAAFPLHDVGLVLITKMYFEIEIWTISRYIYPLGMSKDRSTIHCLFPGLILYLHRRIGCGCAKEIFFQSTVG